MLRNTTRCDSTNKIYIHIPYFPQSITLLGQNKIKRGKSNISRLTRLPRVTIQLKTNIFTEKQEALLYTMNCVADFLLNLTEYESKLFPEGSFKVRSVYLIN